MAPVVQRADGLPRLFIPIGRPGLSSESNFQTVGSSLLALFTMSTGTKWYELVNGCSVVDERYCSPDAADGDACGNPVLATTFFVIFLVVGHMVIPNLFMAVRGLLAVAEGRR